MSEIIIFDERQNRDVPIGAIDYIEQFDMLIKAYISKGSPVVLFRTPIFRAKPKRKEDPPLPFLTDNDIEATKYHFYKDGFKAVLVVKISDYYARTEFEENHFKKCTIVEPSYETCSII